MGLDMLIVHIWGEGKANAKSETTQPQILQTSVITLAPSKT